MFLKLNRYGIPQKITVNIDNIVSYTQEEDKPYTTIRFNVSDKEGSYKQLNVEESVDDIDKTIVHFIAKRFGV